MADNTFKRKFEVKLGGFHIALFGSINESADFGLVSQVLANQVYVDFSNVNYINSPGIKKWILWSKELRAQKKI
jgi:hypothetical protein